MAERKDERIDLRGRIAHLVVVRAVGKTDPGRSVADDVVAVGSERAAAVHIDIGRGRVVAVGGDDRVADGDCAPYLKNAAGAGCSRRFVVGDGAVGDRGAAVVRPDAAAVGVAVRHTVAANGRVGDGEGAGAVNPAARVAGSALAVLLLTVLLMTFNVPGVANTAAKVGWRWYCP